MKFILIIYVFFVYPEFNLDNQIFYNNILKGAFSQYEFIGVTYNLTNDYQKADLVIDPCADFDIIIVSDIDRDGLIGRTIGNIHKNQRLYGKPKIEISNKLNDKDVEYIMTHEIFHALTPTHYHNYLDEESLMYPIQADFTKKLSRYDSLYLSNIFENIYEFWEIRK